MLVRYLLFWLLLAVVAIANGILRQVVYGKFVSTLTAHQISTLTGIVFTGVLVFWLHRFWPIESVRQAWLIGVIWLVMTISFEFGFGHFVAGHPWSALFADYNLLRGRVWLVFLVWMLVLPWLVFRFGRN
ncbi:MAG: hypothetical protein WBS20_07335 [Lysobacterales bacterium]